MRVLLTGGGTGGHITPLLAVAHELKKLDPNIELIGVCEKNAKFAHLFEENSAISNVRQVRAGKYRRYAGLSRTQRLLDVSTMAKNARDAGRVVKGYTEARKLLKELKPDGILIKGGFVGVPVGLAAAHLKIPFITHDSDSTPGLANRIISKWATKYATGMPASFYTYPKDKVVHTGVPISKDFVPVNSNLVKEYRKDLGMGSCDRVITIIGASQGATQLNEDMLALAGRLMQKHKNLGILHISGPAHEQYVKLGYKKELLADELERVVVKGFLTDVFRYTGAADVVISRASATVVAELAAQGKAVILVPGRLADDHQAANAQHLAKDNMALKVDYDDREGLWSAIDELLTNRAKALELAESLHTLAKPNAAEELAKLVHDEFKK